MSINFGKEYKRFRAEQKKLREYYESLGMSKGVRDIRMLVNKIVVSERNGMISIQIKLNAKFTNHIMTYDEDNTAVTNILSSSEAVKKDTPCNEQRVSF